MTYYVLLVLLVLLAAIYLLIDVGRWLEKRGRRKEEEKLAALKEERAAERMKYAHRAVKKIDR